MLALEGIASALVLLLRRRRGRRTLRPSRGAGITEALHKARAA